MYFYVSKINFLLMWLINPLFLAKYVNALYVVYLQYNLYKIKVVQNLLLAVQQAKTATVILHIFVTGS